MVLLIAWLLTSFTLFWTKTRMNKEKTIVERVCLTSFTCVQIQPTATSSQVRDPTASRDWTLPRAPLDALPPLRSKALSPAFADHAFKCALSWSPHLVREAIQKKTEKLFGHVVNKDTKIFHKNHVYLVVCKLPVLPLT